MSTPDQRPDQSIECIPESHEVYEALCALSLAGEMSRDDERRLAEHLKECSECRGLSDDLRNLTLEILPSVGAAIREEQTSWSPYGKVDTVAESRLLAAIESDSKHRTLSFKTHARPRLSWNTIGPLAALLVLGLGGGAELMRLYVLRTEQRRELLSTTVRIERVPDREPSAQLSEAKALLATAESKNRDLELKLKDTTRSLEQQRTDDQVLYRQLNDDQSRMDALAREKSDLSAQLLAATEKAQVLQAASAQHSADDAVRSTRLAEVESRIGDLRTALDLKDRALQQDAELLAHDRDIRDLIGARNVYMAEVYDVAETGKTNKPFGRVFYTKDKSLIFYGYDLDQQPRLKQAVAFQGWGTSEEGHKVNLGLFYQDESKNRWILKFNDAKMLAHVNSVFITVEPKGGSDKPTGRPLLTAFLRLEPNHP